MKYTEELIAERIAKKVGHRMTEKCLVHARAVIEIIDELQSEIEKLRANAMPGGHGCCDICDTGGCCKAESEEEC